MPSPFPGMDPYLEHPEFFPGLHDSMATYVRELLQPGLPEAYYAEIRSRVWVESSRRHFVPDINLLRPNLPPSPAAPRNGGVALAEMVGAQSIAIEVPPDDEIREPFVEIHTRRGGRRLVTAIEILSQTNKTAGEYGHHLYLQKQREIQQSLVNLVEIDLLRSGTHTTLVPLDRAVPVVGTFDYHVCIRRFDDQNHVFVHAIRLEQPLPEIRIHLLPEDGTVALNLQAVFERGYDTGPYRRLSPYREVTPLPPLRPEQAEWANRLLREKGLLPSS